MSRTRLLPPAVAVLAVLAASRLGYELWRLLFAGGVEAAVDLRMLHCWTHDWFAGRPVPGPHPPATYVLSALLAAVSILERNGAGLPRDLLVSLLLLFALVKPAVSAPFFWLVLFAFGAVRVVSITAAGYVVATLWAASLQPDGILSLLAAQSEQAAWLGASAGYANLNWALSAAGLAQWNFAGSAIVVLAAGVWTFRYRAVDPWILCGVAALVARLWTYHRLYDDLLIVVPMVTLLRMMRTESENGRRPVVAGCLLAAAALGLLVPGTLYRLPAAQALPFQLGQMMVWLAMLGFLISQARSDTHRVRAG